MGIFDHLTPAEVGDIITSMLRVLVIAWACRVTIKVINQ